MEKQIKKIYIYMLLIYGNIIYICENSRFLKIILSLNYNMMSNIDLMHKLHPKLYLIIIKHLI